MTNNFQIKALPEAEFTSLFDLSGEELEKAGAVRMIVDKKLAFPCRISLEDGEIGDEVILLPYQHHKTNSPYRSAGPIFVKKNATRARPAVNEIPKLLNHRLLSVREYDKNGMMKASLVTEGQHLKTTLIKIFNNPEIDYVHIHNAKPGCYMCEAVRA